MYARSAGLLERTLSGPELRKIFDLVDTDRSRYIEAPELELAMSEVGFNFSRRQINQMIADAGACTALP